MKTNHMIGITPAHDAPRFDLLRDLGVQCVLQIFRGKAKANESL